MHPKNFLIIIMVIIIVTVIIIIITIIIKLCFICDKMWLSFDKCDNFKRDNKILDIVAQL